MRSPEDWLKQALVILRREGVEGVRVERLARDLSISKGSFYWHFRDRSDLLGRMLDYWDSEMTGAIIEETERKGGTPVQRLWTIMTTVRRRHAADFDVAVRAWAAFDRTAAKVVKRVDARRLDFVRSRFRELGFRGRALDTRTRLFVHYVSTEPSILPRPPAAEGEKLARAALSLLTARPDDQGQG
ncbi:MAG: TetR/AcrR family transcriptional regulator [Alphaproteobacteria bacterium]|nr:TetR/AcrR family transcriptional regulator [Alphaproteobacteria bacterium]